MKEMLIHFDDDDVSVAIVHNRQMLEIYLPRIGEKMLVGNIYKGRVENVLPGMQAAFVNIGLERNCFLYVDDVYTPRGMFGSPPKPEQESPPREINTLLKEGQEVLVQIFKEPVGSKGARVTMQPTLPGRYLVLLPNSDYIAISRRIEEEEERARLKSLMEELLQEGGVIIRTAAAGVAAKELAEDYKSLSKQWRRIQGKAAKSKAPSLVYRDMDFLKRVIRDTSRNDINRILVEDAEARERVLEVVAATAPELESHVILSSEPDLFDAYELEQQMEKTLRRKVWLKSGGYIVFDQTEALTVVDVNTGKYVGGVDLNDTVRTTNLEAVAETARQLRLRNIGGIIVIDFINMENPEDKQQLLQALEEEIKKDRTRITMVGMTPLGLVELTRKKIGHELSYSLEKECPFCGGKGKVLREEIVAQRLRKEIGKSAVASAAPAIKVIANPAVTAALLGPQGRLLAQLESETGKTVVLQSESARRMEESIIRPAYDEAPE